MARDRMQTQNDGDQRHKLVAYIQDAYALENQIVQVLEQHAKQAADFPQIQAQIQRHLEETKQHRARMEARLQAYGEQPSAIKDMGSTLMGGMAGAMAGLRPDTLARNARDEYVTEHLEIAAYVLLITSARAFGDEETVQAAEMNLRDEIAMQQWLAQNLPLVCLLTLQQEGLTISPAAQQFAQQPTGVMSMLMGGSGQMGAADTYGYGTTGSTGATGSI
jgi:ferritin-like metal-binding protein YciE